MNPADAPMVSVVIPTFNRRALLLEAIASVRAQTWRHWELIVVDDASTDDSVEAIRALGDSRIRIIVNAVRRGAGFSRGLGTEAARGDYIAFLDSDDYWLPAKLERQVDAARNSGLAQVVVFGPKAIGDGGDAVPSGHLSRYTGQPIVDFIYAGRGFPLQSSCLLLSADIARKVGFDPALRVNQDTDLLIRLDHAHANFIYLPEVLHVQDTQPRADRISTDPDLVEASLEWFRRVSTDWSPQARCGYYLNDAAIRVARSGDRARALRYYLQGFCLSAGSYYLLRQFLRVLGGGEMPPAFGDMWKRIRPPRSAPG